MDDENNTIDQLAHRRRHARKRKPVVGLLPRYILLAAGFVCVLAIGGMILAKIVDPYQEGAAQQRQISVLRTQLADTQVKNLGLEQRRDALYRPEGVEVAARSEGYLRKGEIRLVLEHDPNPMPEQVHHDSMADRWHNIWLGFVGH